jgi:hypothetical protein
MNQFNIIDVDNNIITSNITEEQVTELMNRDETTFDGYNYFLWPNDDAILNDIKSSEYSQNFRLIKKIEDSIEE